MTMASTQRAKSAQRKAPAEPEVDLPKPLAERERLKQEKFKRAGGNASSVYRLEGVVELKAIYFGETIPKKIDVWKHCGLPLRDPIPGTISFGFGYRNRLELLTAARQYANKRRMDMAVINVYAKPLSLAAQVNWDQLGKKDFGMVAADNTLPRHQQDELSLQWRDWAMKDTGLSLPKLEKLCNWDSATSYIPRFPKYVPNLLKQWRLQIVAHLAYLEFSDKPMMVATLKPRSVEVLFAEPAVVTAFPDTEITF